MYAIDLLREDNTLTHTKAHTTEEQIANELVEESKPSIALWTSLQSVCKSHSYADIEQHSTVICVSKCKRDKLFVLM